MTGIRALRVELATALAPTGLQPYDVWPESPELPAFVVGWPSSLVPLTLAGGRDIYVPITVALPIADFEDAQRKLDDLFDSIPSLIDTLDNRAVDRIENIAIDKAGEAQCLMAVFIVHAIA
jgi:hypothetical protein